MDTKTVACTDRRIIIVYLPINKIKEDFCGPYI